MLLQNAMNLRATNGIYSSGAFQTNYDLLWNQDKKYLTGGTAPGEENNILLILQDKSNTVLQNKNNATTASIKDVFSEKTLIQYYHKLKLDKRLEALIQRGHDWDERGSEKPNSLSINNTREILNDLLNLVIKTGSQWVTPFISSDETGNITVEWHKGNHELHLEITEQEAEYIKVWGINIQNEMQTGHFDKNNYLTLWEWLLNG